MNTILSWFYGTYLGGLYFDILLWIDRKFNKPKFLTPKEIAQVVREYSKIAEGTKQIKKNINELLNSKTKDEYHKVLSGIEDLTQLATDDSLEEFKSILRDMYVKKGNKDITTHIQMAKMIDQRIEDTKELWEDKAKRQLLRQIREAKQSNNTELVNKLQSEFKLKYGRYNTRLRQS
jgi:uncharacterized membrane protein YheB (UPF0754 family)